MESQNSETEAKARQELGNHLREAAALKTEIQSKEAEVELLKEKFKGLSDTILGTLDLLELESIKAHGFLFFKETRSSVTTPKSPEEKKALFDFLESKGIFLEMVSVNSQTLNSLYKSLEAEALKRGELEFRLPGVPEPTTYINLKLKRA